MKLIRKAKAGDVSRLFSILVEATREGGSGYYPDDILEDWHSGRTAAGMAEVLRYETFYVLQHEDELRAYVHISKGQIVGLFVDPKDHGKGYGRAMVEFAKKEIRDSTYWWEQVVGNLSISVNEDLSSMGKADLAEEVRELADYIEQEYRNDPRS